MKKNDTRLQLRLSLKEKEKIERNAKRCGMSVSGYVRQCCLGRETRCRPPDVFWELLEEFAYCEDTLLESAESADTIIRLIAAGMPEPGDGYASVKNQKVTLLDSTGQQMESKR